jgi:glycosyltransferase involved in cell wall biosynthesis
MKILVHASRELAHPNAGGSEVYVDHVLSGLVEMGHEVELVTAGPVGKRAYKTTAAGEGTLGQFVRAPLRLMGARRDVDVVVDVTNGMTFFSPLFSRKPTVNLVHHIHTQMWAEWFSPPVAALGRFLEARAMPWAYRESNFVTASESTQLELMRLGVKGDHVRIVFNSTDVPEEPVAPKDAEPLFVACGRLVPHKQFHLLLEQWPNVRKQTGGRLVIIGEGPERERLEGMLTEGAELAGKVTLEERDELFARATALIHPAYVEGWGLVIMEAAAQGTPAIGLDVPGVRDSIVDGESGWVCHDLNHMVKQWIATVTEPDDMPKFNQNARRRAQEFGVGRQVQDFAAAIQAAVEREPVRRRQVWFGRTPRPAASDAAAVSVS